MLSAWFGHGDAAQGQRTLRHGYVNIISHFADGGRRG
jgi:hypothetical protein